MTEKPEFGSNSPTASSENQFGNLPNSDSGSGRQTGDREPGNAGSLRANDAASYEGSGNLSMLMGVHLTLTVELGRTNLSVRQVLELQKGTVVELDRTAGEAVDIYVNDRLIAHGDVVVVDDKFGIRITELVSPNEGTND